MKTIESVMKEILTNLNSMKVTIVDQTNVRKATGIVTYQTPTGKELNETRVTLEIWIVLSTREEDGKSWKVHIRDSSAIPQASKQRNPTISHLITTMRVAHIFSSFTIQVRGSLMRKIAKRVTKFSQTSKRDTRDLPRLPAQEARA